MGSDARRKKLGRFGEDVAASFLERRGLEIVGRNVRVGRDELDIVAKHGHSAVVVEVKATADGSNPLHAVDEVKIDNIVRAIGALRMGRARIDVVAVAVGEEGVTVRWLAGAA